MNIKQNMLANSLIIAEVKQIVILLQLKKNEVAFTKFDTLSRAAELMGKKGQLLEILYSDMLSCGFKEWQFDGFICSYQHASIKHGYEIHTPNWEV